MSERIDKAKEKLQLQGRQQDHADAELEDARTSCEQQQVSARAMNSARTRA